MPDKTLIDTVVLKQDIGGPAPRFKKVKLLCWSDGSVTWETPDDNNGELRSVVSFVGDA